MHLKNSGVGVQDLRLVGELRHFGGELEQRVGEEGRLSLTLTG